MKRKGLPAYFVLPTQMHKECSLAPLWWHGIFFRVQTTLLPQKDQESNKQSKCFVYCLKIATFAAKEKEI